MAGQPGDFAVGEVIGIGWAAVRRQPLELIGGFVVTMGLQQVLQSLAQWLAGSAGALGASLAGMAVGIVVGAFLWTGQARAALLAARGEAVDFGVFFSGGDRFGVMLLALIAMYAAIALGFILLLVPGIIAALGLLATPYFVADTECSVGEALRESWEVTRGHRMQLFGLCIVLFLVLMLGVLALILGILVALPVVSVAMAAVYVRLSGNAQSPS
jgi:hypothetical protein